MAQLYQLPGPQRSAPPALTRIDAVLRRIRNKYLQTPEFRLTLEEAQDLWQLERTECEALLIALVDAAFLRRVGGAFMHSGSTRLVP